MSSRIVKMYFSGDVTVSVVIVVAENVVTEMSDEPFEYL